MMASIVQGRLRLPAHVRVSVIALVAMVGLVWLLFFGVSPHMRPTALRADGLAPTAGRAVALSGLSPRLARLSATAPHRQVQVIILLRRGVSAAQGRSLVG